jgi:hypothetical protein
MLNRYNIHNFCTKMQDFEKTHHTDYVFIVFEEHRFFK